MRSAMDQNSTQCPADCYREWRETHRHRSDPEADATNVSTHRQSQGFSIFARNKKDIVPYFSSIDYSISEDTNITEFLTDVSSGTERCIGKRQKDLPDPPLLHASFEKSSYFEKADATGNFTAILPEKTVRYYGYTTGDGFLAQVYRSTDLALCVEEQFGRSLERLKTLRKGLALILWWLV